MMDLIINILCFAGGIFIAIKLFKDRWGIKQLGVICIGMALLSGLCYICARYLNVGFVLLPTQPALKDPANAMKVTALMFKTGLAFFPLAYIFEWWYYKKHPDIDPYSGKSKSEMAADKKRKEDIERAQSEERKRQEEEDANDDTNYRLY
ncbi:hypothetical protein [Ruficoccus sp. ZRK36]|uniref:hypothetical protein n=1 Tax=Ruficoccus sp. ZRK36 TaxID=2866311 RepID=UPI001C72D470|nr:hypothetical protein [Ruficoccus sp. ZRK36]QYY34819.1 hypothetical protein K0V07_10960 [Ruficoccus sp. ZRK36]